MRVGLLVITAIVTGCGSAEVGRLEGEGVTTVAPASWPLLAGHWMRVQLADNHTADIWWSFEEAASFRRTEQRLSCCAEPASSTRAVSGSATADQGRVALAWIDDGLEHGATFTGAIFSAGDLVPAFRPLEYVPWHAELAAGDRVLHTRALHLDGGAYRGERSISRAGNEPFERREMIAVKLDHPLDQVMNGAPCHVTITVSAERLQSGVRLHGEETLAFDCVLEPSAHAAWKVLSLPDRSWWRSFEAQVPRDRHPSELDQMMRQALSLPLHVHLGAEEVLVERDFEVLHQMRSPPPDSGASPP